MKSTPSFFDTIRAMVKDNKRVLVAMSGGVDSSAAAALLKNQEYDVSGVFMHFWSEPRARRAENICCSVESESDARAVASKLKIPFYVFHFEKEFKNYVVDYFLRENKKGLTPNPCVMCNRRIKFEFLLNKALSLGFDFVATGHYAKIKKGKRGKYHFLTAEDQRKDQSYFLYAISQKQMSRFLFPLADLTKKEVRALARKNDLPTHSKIESFDLCFVGDSHVNFLSRNLKIKTGDIIDTQGNILGRHKGLPLYTVGQRKDIGLSSGPYYVCGFDFKRNRLIVTNDMRDEKLFSGQMIVKNASWVLGEPKLPLRAKVKIRYRHESVGAVISKKISPVKYLVRFINPQRAVTPGQAAVFYKGKEMLGGGTIA